MTRQYPQRSNSHQLEALSERFFISSLPRNWQHDKPTTDYGVDLRVDIFEGKNATGLEILIQLKSSHAGDSSQYETIRMRTATYNHLWDKLQVVMLVKYVEEEGEAYWLLLKDVPEPSQKQNTFTIRIPKSNRLSTIDWSDIHRYIRGVTDDKLAARRRKILSQT